MATQFRRGAEAIAKAAERSGGKFTPTLKWDAGEIKYLQFLTPMSDIPTVLMHNFIIVGFREDGNKMYESFISRRDPALDGPKGYDELADRFGETPKAKSIALAVELEAVTKRQGTRNVIEGFQVGTRQFENKEGETVEVPAVGLVIQSPSIFFSHLAVLDDMHPIESKIFAVKRTGKSTDTTYTLSAVGESIEGIEDDLEEFLAEFDFDSYLEELADEDRMRELIEPLADDFVVNPYSKRGKQKSPSSARKAPSRSRATADAAEEPAEETDAEPEAPTETPSRRRRFAALKTEVEAPEEG